MIQSSVELAPGPFPEARSFLGAPEGMPDCGVLPCYRDGRVVVSCWPLTWKARLQVLLGGQVWMQVHGFTQMPVALSVSRRGPFVAATGDGQTSAEVA